MAEKKPDLKEIHAQALKRADEAYSFERENIRKGREDQKFYFGDQWDEAAKLARGKDRPMLTVPRLGTFVRQVTGDLRQNTPAVKVLPSGGNASEEKAEVFGGIIRSIEAKSDAAACYVKAASNAAETGQGAFRVLTKYCDETSFDQEIVIERIADPFGVLLDPFARAPDKSDMGYGFIVEPYSKEAFEAKWPKATVSDFPTQNDTGLSFEWKRGEQIIVAEYWCREVEVKKLYLANGAATDKPPPKGVEAERERDVEVVSIVSYMMSGKEILSGPHPWAGTVGIPICFIPGEESTIEGATQRKGMVRDAKDPQRLLNYARTAEAESTALQPKAPYVATADQIKGYEDIWNTAGTKNHSVLIYNANPALGANQAPQRSQPPVMSSGLSNLSQMAGMDMHDVTGIYPASLGAKSNETSGIAIRARQHEGDTGSNYIADNTRRAIAYCGRLCVDLIPKVMDSERIVRILKEDGSHEMAKINADPMQPQSPDDAADLKIIDTLGDGKYDVVVATGPSYLTRQQEMAETIVELARTMPIVGQAAPDLLVKALNFPGGDEIAKRLEKMLPPGLTEDGPMQPPPPDPEKIAGALDKAASADLKHAQTAKTLLEADQLAAQMSAMGVQLQGLTQLVQALAQGGGPQGGPPQQPPMPPPDAMPPGAPGQPVPGPPPMMNGADGGGDIVDLEPIEGAPV